MPAIKNALLRYRIIDRAIRNEYTPFPTKRQLRQACEEEIFGSTNESHICDSTIEKDIFSMRMDHDAPIVYSKKEKGYFYEDPLFSMEDVPLTQKDINAIKSASIILSQFKNTSLFGQYEFAIQKILDRAISSEKRQANESQVIQFETLPTVRGNENLELFLEAINSRKVVQFYYNNFIKNEKTVRRVNPYLLKEYRNRWYLIGKSEIKNKVVTFGLDRIFDPIVLEKNYVQDNNFSPDVYFKHSLGITVNDQQLPTEIIIQTDPILSKYLSSQPIHHSQKIDNVDENGYHTFSLFLMITYELKMLLLGFGKDCKVVSPIDFREEILKDLKSAIKNYNL